jgi:DNA-binding Xre family transcriptional regulator
VIRLKVKEIAEERELSMSKLSRMSDVHYNTIRDIFIHPYRDVALSTLYKLAVALNVDIHDLYQIVPNEEGE